MSTRLGSEGAPLSGTPGRRLGADPVPDDLDTGLDLDPFDHTSGPDDPLEEGFEPFEDDGIPDAALFLPFRDGRPGWR